MPLTDLKGNKWAHRDTIRVGDRVRPDGGFTCMKEGSLKIVRSTVNRRSLGAAANIPFESLFVECGCGKHFLDGQLGKDGEIVGLYPASR